MGSFIVDKESIVVILQIVTIIVSIVSLVLNAIITISQARKSNFVSVTANQWKEFFVQNRERYSKIITLCTPECIKELKDNPEYVSYKNDVKIQEIQLMYYWKLYYPEEAELIDSLHKLIILAYKYYDDASSENESLLRKQLSSFYKLSAIYDSADWRLIRKQAYGKDVSNERFEVIYKKGKQQFEQHNTDLFFLRQNDSEEDETHTSPN